MKYHNTNLIYDVDKVVLLKDLRYSAVLRAMIDRNGLSALLFDISNIVSEEMIVEFEDRAKNEL